MHRLMVRIAVIAVRPSNNDDLIGSLSADCTWGRMTSVSWMS